MQLVCTLYNEESQWKSAVPYITGAMQNIGKKENLKCTIIQPIKKINCVITCADQITSIKLATHELTQFKKETFDRHSKHPKLL